MSCLRLIYIRNEDANFTILNLKMASKSASHMAGRSKLAFPSMRYHSGLITGLI